MGSCSCTIIFTGVVVAVVIVSYGALVVVIRYVLWLLLLYLALA